MRNGVAIVFVATDEAHVLIPALESLDEHPPEHPLQIVVVDNASTDGMAETVRRRWPHIPVLPQPYRRGRAWHPTRAGRRRRGPRPPAGRPPTHLPRRGGGRAPPP